MKLGLMWGYWGAAPPPDVIGVTQEAERLGFDSVWSAEAWGSDAFSPLAWIAGHTSTIKLGTSVVQLSARTPTAAAMAALTMDHLSGGRFILGLGASHCLGQTSKSMLEQCREVVAHEKTPSPFPPDKVLSATACTNYIYGFVGGYLVTLQLVGAKGQICFPSGATPTQLMPAPQVTATPQCRSTSPPSRVQWTVRPCSGPCPRRGRPGSLPRARCSGSAASRTRGTSGIGRCACS